MKDCNCINCVKCNLRHIGKYKDCSNLFKKRFIDVICATCLLQINCNISCKLITYKDEDQIKS